MKLNAVATFEVENISFGELTGKERRCAECHQLITEGEEVVIFCLTKYENDKIELNDNLIFLHLAAPSQKGSCVAEYVGKVIASTEYETPTQSNALPPAEKSDSATTPVTGS